MQLTKVYTNNQYDFYIGHATPTDGVKQYPIYNNIVPKGTEAPKGGYRSMSYIEHIKHAKFPTEVLNHE